MIDTNVNAERAAVYLPIPGEADHKYTRGTVLLITGSEKYPGAGVLSAGGASYGGAGMVRFGGSDRSADLVLQRFPEVVLSLSASDSLVVGSGWGQDLRDAAQAAVAAHRGPLVVDAGALPLFASHDGGAAVTVLTPHPGEARQLWADLNLPGGYPDVPAVAAQRLSQATGAIVVLKAATTAVSDGTTTLRYRAKTAWPGVAGAGDVLSGLLGSVLARHCKLGGNDWVQAAGAAVWLHGEAGALAAGVGEAATHPMRASDIVKSLPAAWDTVPR